MSSVDSWLLVASLDQTSPPAPDHNIASISVAAKTQHRSVQEKQSWFRVEQWRWLSWFGASWSGSRFTTSTPQSLSHQNSYRTPKHLDHLQHDDTGDLHGVDMPKMEVPLNFRQSNTLLLSLSIACGGAISSTGRMKELTAPRSTEAMLVLRPLDPAASARGASSSLLHTWREARGQVYVRP